MDQLSKRGSRTGSEGFSLTEALVSVAILALLAFFTVADLRTSQRRDELNNAARVVAADLRSIQNQAITGKNIKFCQTATAATVACELDTGNCADPGTCEAAPPMGIGIHFLVGWNFYRFYAKNDPATTEWTAQPEDTISERNLERSGAGTDVFVSSIVPDLAGNGDVIFQRQNGGMHINPCAGCTEPPELRITLYHQKTNESKTVVMNAFTGRISIE